MLDVFIVLKLIASKRFDSVVQTNENHFELNLDCMANVVTICAPSLKYFVLSDGCCVVVHCQVEV